MLSGAFARQRDHRRRHDIQVAVTVDVDGQRPVRPGQRRDGMSRVRVTPFVFQPLDPVIRLEQEVVERVAVGDEHVEVAVAVEIDQLHARRTPVRMRRRVDRLLREGRRRHR